VCSASLTRKFFGAAHVGQTIAEAMTTLAPSHLELTGQRLRVRRWRRRAAIGGLAMCLVVALLLHVPWSLADYPALAQSAQPLTVHSRTGVTLVGRFFPGTSGATIVLSHGYGGDQDEMLPVASTLHAAGFTVVTYDERGRGGSGGTGTWGALETEDLRSVIDTVVRHRSVDPNEIGAFGFSIGADITILEAASDRRVKAVVAAGSWPSVYDYMKPSLWDIILHPNDSYSPLALDLMQLRTGADLDQVRPAAVIGRISPRPILLIQGLADTDVKPWMGITNFEHARPPRQLWLVKGEGHEDTVKPGGAATSPRVAEFFAHALLGRTTPTAVAASASRPTPRLSRS
jgi:fermentation-respiration switch protein FrsA (DUF1100 family)